jgi:ketosteroid isomerase-like protein
MRGLEPRRGAAAPRPKPERPMNLTHCPSLPPRRSAAARAGRALLTLALVVPALAGLAGCETAARHAATSGTPAVVEHLTGQADRWDRDIVAKDRVAIEANMADDFRQIDGAGRIETRASFVDDLMDPALTIDPYTVEDFEVRLYGDVALLSGRTRMTGRYQGKPFRTHYRYIDVYVRQGDRWRVVSVQISRIPEPAGRP